MSEEPDLSQIANKLKSDGMKCNCNLDNWEPEKLTGHSHVCRIHKEAIRIYTRGNRK